MPTKFKWDTEAERDLWRAICSPNRWFSEDGSVSTHPDSLWWFVSLAWGVEFYFQHHPTQSKWFYDPLHRPYLDWLQYHLLMWKKVCLQGGTDRYFIASVLPRGYGKTVTTTKSAMIWVHLDEPDMSTLIGSSTMDFAEDTYNAIQSIISGEDEDSWFAWLYGNWKQGAREWTKQTLHHGYRRSKNLTEPSFDVTSVDVGMTGYHHRIHCWDDPIYANKLREGKQAYLRNVHTAIDASYNALQSNGLMAFVLTRYLDDDVAGRHFREEGIASWSGMDCPNMAMFDKVPMGQGNWHVYFLQTEDELTGEPTHPILWTKAKIATEKRRNAEDFACQQQNNPGASERAPLLESQLQELFMDYTQFMYEVTIDAASVHIDTAFKTPETIRTGDDNAILVWLHDAARNGKIYLDTDNLKASNEWKEEEFNTELVKVLINLRKRAIRLKALTDEQEKFGKTGSYKNRLLSVIKGSGLQLHFENFKQINRTANKKARIRSSLGYWVEGYVRILLHKDKDGAWIIPSVVRRLFSQVLRVDATQHDDLADASADGFIPGIWVPPSIHTYDSDEGAYTRSPWEEGIKSFERPLTNEELYEMIDQNKEIQRTMGPGRGWEVDRDDYDYQLPQDPV